MLKNLKLELQAFGKYVVQQSRTNLTKGKHNVTKELYNSISYTEPKEQNGIYSIEWIMDEYGSYIDKGVHGTKSSYVTAKNSPFRYKESSKIMGFEYYTGTFAKWAKAKNIRLRDEKGKFKKGNYKSIGYVIARSIKEKGIKPTFFFTKAFDNAFKRFPPLLLEAMTQDIIDKLKENNNGKN
jgi:hypothetical protein